jgi:glycosyltransferase involved in cell wall biosynthesis
MKRRILHVIGGMQRGGIQSWLMHLLRTIDRQRYQMDFLVHGNQPGAYDPEIIQLGSSLLHCSEKHRSWTYAHGFTRLLEAQEPYDAVHSHVYSFTGFVLRLAARQGIPLRIAHVHNDRRAVEAGAGLIRHLQLRLMKAWIRKHAVVKLAASAEAAEDLFGACWELDPAVRVVHCGVDLTPFALEPDRTGVRTGLELPADAIVIGHVGRFVAQKNHAFLVDVAAEAMKLDDRVRLLLVGDGPLRGELKRQAIALGIAERVLFAGERDDVPRLMGAAMDLFVFPSVHEGLGLALIEAQAAGLPCLIADRVPREADVIGGLISRLPIEQAPSEWAKRIMEISAAPRPGRVEALAAVEESSFNITRSVQQMTRIYDGHF